MYASFAIQNFRCFERLTVEPLAWVNLICGENNTGKTALLETLWLRSVGDALALQRVDAYLACRNPGGVSAGAHGKAGLYTHLAVAGEPGRRLGEVADAGVWNWNSPAFQPLAAFLRQLGP